MLSDNRTQSVNQLGAGRIVKSVAGRRLVERNHRVEIEEPDNRLAWSKISDDVTDLNRMAIARTMSLAAAKTWRKLARRSVSTAPPEPASSGFRKVVVARVLVVAFFHTFPS